MTKTLVLVADSSRARLYLADTPASTLREVEDFVAPEGRMHEQELVSDRPGSGRTAGGIGLRAFDPPTSAVEEARVMFAKHLAGRLEHERNKGVFDRLVLVAPAAMLGKLRAELTPPLAGLLAESIDKNLIEHSVQEVRDHVSVLL